MCIQLHKPDNNMLFHSSSWLLCAIISHRKGFFCCLAGWQGGGGGGGIICFATWRAREKHNNKFPVMYEMNGCILPSSRQHPTRFARGGRPRPRYPPPPPLQLNSDCCTHKITMTGARGRNGYYDWWLGCCGVEEAKIISFCNHNRLIVQNTIRIHIASNRAATT